MKHRQKIKSVALKSYRKKLASVNKKIKNHPELLAAHDFRAQQQMRFTNVDGKTFREEIRRRFPDAMAHLRKVFPGSDINFDVGLIDAVELVTELDEPLTHSLIRDTQDLVEGAAKALGFDIFHGVSAGAISSPGIEAYQQRLMLTQASVVLVSQNMILALHRLSKLLSLNVPIVNVKDGKFSIGDQMRDFAIVVDNDPQLQHLWREFFIQYSLFPADPPRGSAVAVPSLERTTMMADLMESMICFVVAHEYGHHMAAHGLGGAAGVDGPDRSVQHNQEIEADMLGALVTMKIGDTRNNFFAISGIGAIVVLKVLDLFRRGSAIISTGKEPDKPLRETHPDLESRVKAIRACGKACIEKEHFEVALRVQNAFMENLDHVWDNCRDELIRLHVEGVKPAASKSEEWLPF